MFLRHRCLPDLFPKRLCDYALGTFCKQIGTIYHCDTHYENNSIQRCALLWERVNQKWITLNCQVVK
ncbi:hypothetical protein Krac_9743 [Ktedonobacter racemifer DSM 44963]|uniref:Uncharacterized protein n=1 Tax=Ktedonobacter racemifer DSM 44963 TaxID=485913 RepID=D6TDG6_KTERA|nr:hypothetical protein Krac_9743 [Ktedonobacter racemifer DSM 44963]